MKRQRKPAPQPLDLDAIKRAGLHSDEHSRRMVEAYERQERERVRREIERKKEGGL